MFKLKKLNPTLEFSSSPNFSEGFPPSPPDERSCSPPSFYPNPSEEINRLRQFAEIATTLTPTLTPSLKSHILNSYLLSALNPPLSSSPSPPPPSSSSPHPSSSPPPQEYPIDLRVSKKLEYMERRDSVGSTGSVASDSSDR